MAGFPQASISGFDQTQAFLIEALGDLSRPLGFLAARPGMTLEEARDALGPPAHESWDNPAHRHIAYELPVDHPVEGPRAHHEIRLVISSYNGGPISGAQIGFEYFRLPEWDTMIDALMAHLTSNLGKPSKRKKKGGRLEAEWRRGTEKLWLLVKGTKLQLDISG